MSDREDDKFVTKGELYRLLEPLAGAVLSSSAACGALAGGRHEVAFEKLEEVGQLMNDMIAVMKEIIEHDERNPS